MFTITAAITVAVVCVHCQARFTAEYEDIHSGDKLKPLDQMVCPKCGQAGGIAVQTAKVDVHQLEA